MYNIIIETPKRLQEKWLNHLTLDDPKPKPTSAYKPYTIQAYLIQNELM